MTSGLDVRLLVPDDADACDRIVLGLPYHFGFLTWQRRFEEAAEVTWMAVRRDHRGEGLGHALVDAVVARLRAEGVRLLVVLTVSPNDADEPDAEDRGFEATRAFYRSGGFVTARDLPREWPGDLAVLFARPV